MPPPPPNRILKRSVSAATAANALLFFIALVILHGLKKHTPSVAPKALQAENTWTSLRSGLSYVRTEGLIGRLLLVITAQNLCLAAPLNVGLALAKDHHWGPGGFSILITGFASGAIAGALFMASRKSPHRPGAAGLLWAASCGIFLALLPWLAPLPLAVASAALTGFTIGPSGALLFGLVQARTHDDYRGRVTSLATFSALGLRPISYTLFGLLAGASGQSQPFSAAEQPSLPQAPWPTPTAPCAPQCFPHSCTQRHRANARHRTGQGRGAQRDTRRDARRSGGRVPRR
ncbi:MFS transporter (plasmid) [Streptomyces sp. CA-294286]|uniref:MFS transporter n=1 Tax=Streptomyces sp. CA-294286 TaxID=3240070 RepID=UPI003D9463D5